MKCDYWGYYKSDASSNGYSCYVTDTSSKWNDAWCMRKITNPLGATTEMNYESSTYEKVMDGNGGFNGPARIYSIKSITLPASTSDYGWKWDYTLDEDITTPADFTFLKTTPPE